MKRFLLVISIAAVLFPLFPKAEAQTISYNSPQTYNVGTTITPLAPTSSGVAGLGYSNTPIVLGSGYNAPQGVALDAVGDIFVADCNNNIVEEIPVGGGPQVIIGSGFNRPTDVAVDAAGNVYVVDNGNNAVKEVPAGGGPIITLATGFSSPQGIVLDANGNMYVADYYNNAIKKIPAGGGTPVTLVSGISTPQGVALDVAGNIYVAADGASSITKIIMPGLSEVAVGTGLSGPQGVAVDAAGNVFVADYGNNAVKEIPFSGGSYGAPITIGSGFNGPDCDVLDGAGDVYVADQNNNEIKEIKPIGGYYISTALPAGLIFNNNTGVISGTPTAISPKTNYTVTAYSGSSSASTIVTITVITLLPTITAGTSTGYISACAGTASASPNIQQFTVSGSNLTANITATAPTGFEVSLTAGGPYGKTAPLNQTGGTVATTTVYVRSAATASGNISGNVTITSTGATDQNVAVTGAVNVLPTVNAVANQTVLSGAATTAINFTGTANTFTWVNNTPGVGLAAIGTGNIASFTAVNNGNKPVIATITATPISAGFAYITNSGSNNVSVINTVTNVVIGTIPVGSGPSRVSVSLGENRIYVTNFNDGTVSVINSATNKVIDTIPVGSNPTGVAISPNGSPVYVSNYGSNTVSVIDTLTNKVTTTIEVGSLPQNICVNPNGSLIYVTNSNDGTVSVINTLTNAVIDIITVGSYPDDLSISPDGSLVYVANANSGTVSVISTSANKVVSTISVGTQPVGVSVTPNGSWVYVTNQGSGTVSVINTATNVVEKTILVGSTPVGVSVSPDGSRVYVANYGSNTVSVISTTSNSVMQTIAVGLLPDSFGNFVTSDISCSGTPVTFTITVDPPPPSITASTVTGNISACAGTASVSPNIQQFTVSGSNLTAGITVTAPTGFEISLSQGIGYVSSFALALTGDSVSSTIIYVRSAASASIGNISGNVMLTSAGATSQNVAVSGIVNADVTPSVSIAGSANNICVGTPVTFTATPINGGADPVYQWIVNGINSGANNATFSSSTFANGDMVSCTMTSNATCLTSPTSTSNSITMNVIPQVIPSINIAASAINICAGVPVTFTATPTSGGNSPGYQWLLNGNNTGTDSATFSSSTLANGDVISCVMTSNAVCATPANIRSNSIAIIVYPSPIVNAGGNTTIKEGTSTVLNATATGNIADITWSPSAGLSSNKILTPTASPSLTTTYTLTIQTTDGCIGTDSAKVTVFIDISIPNAFTPNGDGVNDTWNIKYLDLYPNCTVAIFNRWGENVYSSIGYGVPWDGTYRGTALPTGTYYYIVNLKNGSKVLSGYVAILR